ncbi:MAG: MCE family protein [Deltaproteobacteria bacterium]|nr:MCE family protein [Deltaproteobacteria bacterium]
MEERNLEIKVGILVLVAGALLTGFIFVMGGISFEDRFDVYVDFNNPLWLSEGATVKISGTKAGKVEEITFMGGKLDPKVNRRVYVRVKLSIAERVRGALHADAQFYIANQGLLGEQYVEIDPGTFEAPAMDFSKAQLGNDPPRLEKFLIQGYEMIQKLDKLLDAGGEDISGMLGTVARALRSLDRGMSAIGDVIGENKEDINAIAANVRTLSEEALGAVRDARAWLQEGGKVDLILSDVRELTQDLPDRADGLFDQLESTVQRVDRVVANLDGVISDTLGERQRSQIRSVIANLERVSDRAVVVADDVGVLVAEVRTQVDPVVTRVREAVDGVGRLVDTANDIARTIQRGEGTVGALIMDEQIFDDLKELIRDLKHNPWKFFWRE